MPCLPIGTVADYRGAEVYTLEGKSVGRIKEINSGYFTAFKRGLVTDEEFRIPMSAISSVESDGSSTRITLSLKEEQVKHGFEFAKGKPNSEFMHGAAKSEPKIPDEKQLIRYEPTQGAEETASSKRPPAVSEYLCDMCNEKFASPEELHEHRAVQHKGPTGV